MSSYLKKEISEWTNSDLCGWLTANKFRGISELFQKYSISGYDLFYINDDILKNELGLNSFHERRVALKLITKLTYEHLKLNIINSNGDNVILTLDNNHETTLGEISNYIGNMFDIEPKNILFKDATKQEVLSPTIKIIKLLILYPKLYKTLNISNMKEYHQNEEELQRSGDTRFNSVESMEQSMNDREIINKNYTQNNINKNNIYNIDENKKNNFREKNYNFNHDNNNNFNNQNNNNFMINRAPNNLINNEENIDNKKEKLNIKSNNNMNTNIINNINTNTAETPINENRERIYQSEKRVYRTLNDFNQKQINQKIEEDYNNMRYNNNELSGSSGNEEEIKFKPSYQIKKNNNMNKDNYYNFLKKNNLQKNFEEINEEDYIPSKNMENKSFYKNKVFNEDFDDPNYNNRIINN